jgi:hypothetical protein
MNLVVDNPDELAREFASPIQHAPQNLCGHHKEQSLRVDVYTMRCLSRNATLAAQSASFKSRENKSYKFLLNSVDVRLRFDHYVSSTAFFFPLPEGGELPPLDQ